MRRTFRAFCARIVLVVLACMLVATTNASAEYVWRVRTSRAENITYATPDRPGHIDLANGTLHRDDVFDARQRLVRRRYTGPAGVIAELRYAYDGADREVARQSMHRGGKVDVFAYDDDSRLLRADLGVRLLAPENAPVSGTPSFAAGEPLLGGLTAPAPLSGAALLPGDYARTYAHDVAKDHLTQTIPSTWAGAAYAPPVPDFAETYANEDGLGFLQTIDGQTRTRDALGNATHIQGSVLAVPGDVDLVYDAHSRLRQVTRPDGTAVAYDYRADGLLAKRSRTCGLSAPAGCTDGTEVYVYDGLLLLEIWDVGAQYTTGRQLRIRYLYAEEGHAVSDVPFAADLRLGATLVRHYVVADRQGSILGLVDTSGAWLERVHYDPYGAPRFEPADVLAPQVAKVTVDASGEVVLTMTESIVPAPLGGTSDDISTQAVDLSAALVVRDDQGQVVNGTVELDVERSLQDGAPLASVLKWTPGAGMTPGNTYSLELPAGAVVDDWANGNVSVNLSLQYTAGVAYTGPPEGSTAAVLASTSVVGNRVLFQSHLYDEDVGLYLMRARVWDARVGMYLQRDPSGYVDSVNLYAGFVNNPVNVRDPTGRIGVGLDTNYFSPRDYAERNKNHSLQAPGWWAGAQLATAGALGLGVTLGTGGLGAGGAWAAITSILGFASGQAAVATGVYSAATSQPDVANRGAQILATTSCSGCLVGGTIGAGVDGERGMSYGTAVGATVELAAAGVTWAAGQYKLASELRHLTAHPDAHTLARHGGTVTDEELMRRAWTGVAPDGTVKIGLHGDPVLPPVSSAFHSDQLAIQATRMLEEGPLAAAINANPGATVHANLTLETGIDVGRGFSRIAGSRFRGYQGPLQLHPRLTKVRGTFELNPQTGRWEPITVFPDL